MPRGFTIRDRGRREKERRLRLWPSFVDKFVRDAANEFLKSLIDETIAGAPGTIPTAAPGSETVVGVQTGFLRRSQELNKEGVLWVLKANLGIARYAQSVAERVYGIHGRDYLRITQFFNEKRLKDEFHKLRQRFVSTIMANREPRYSNPF